MIVIVGDISVEYEGRGKTYLPKYNRMVIFKNDGSIAIHGDNGYKPYNYMTSSTKLFEDKIIDDDTGEEVLRWIITGKKEQLVITFHSIYDKIEIALGKNDPGLQREQTEDELQEWLSKNVSLFGDNCELVSREFQTGAGPIDILIKQGKDVLVPVEVKRVATLNAVGQLQRYCESLAERYPNKILKPYIAALSFKDSCLKHASKKDYTCFYVPSDWNERKDNSLIEQVEESSLFD